MQMRLTFPPALHQPQGAGTTGSAEAGAEHSGQGHMANLPGCCSWGQLYLLDVAEPAVFALPS